MGPPPLTSQTYYEQPPNSNVTNNYRQNKSPLTSVNPHQYQPTPPSVPGFHGATHPYMPSPSTSPMQLPPPPQIESLTDDLYKSSQQKNLPEPPPARQVPEHTSGGPFDYQQSQRSWPQQPITDPFIVNTSAPTWQTTPISQHYNHAQAPQQQPIHAPTSSGAFQTSATESFTNQYSTLSSTQTKDVSNGPSFFENIESTPIEQLTGKQEAFGHYQASPFPPTSNARPPSVKPENVEALQPPIVPALTAPPWSTPNVVPSNEVFYPENRERLDDVSTPLSTSSTSVTDRHNYLVTGQLSQDRMTWPQQQPPIEGSRNFSEEQPPRGLSRMVVGQPENNQDQAAVPDILPPFNRMVTGTETTQSNYINYQRQADGEVSYAPPVIPRPQSNSPFTHNVHQSIPEVVQQSFNTSDRNLYLVAGESDINEHRVIPGVESNVPASIINPMQNLHIQEDESFVNVSVPVQERNVNVDGMETVPDTQQQQQQQRSIDTEPREEDIDGANDNTESFNNTSANPGHEHVLARVSNEMESDIREEAIEGANDYNDDNKRSADDSKNKLDKSHKSRSALSSEDSELRDLDLNKSKTRPRRIKKYTDDSNESENEYSDGDKRNKYRRPPREKMSREEYEKSRRREKERRSDERPRKGDDTDGSKYGESKRRTEDEDEYRRNRDKYKKSSSRRRPEDDVNDKEKKRDKYHEGGSRKSKIPTSYCF